MTKREAKDKLQIPLRTPRPKGDMFRNLRRPEEVESLTMEELTTPPSLDPPKVALDHLRPPKASNDPRPPTDAPAEQIAPARDFNKRANSLDRDALPSGLFPGSSKKIYDALYIRTLGAVVPMKTIQATRRELSKWSGIRNVKTIAAHLRHFNTVGLIIHKWDKGSNEGSVYEVRVPEELDGLRPPQTTQGTLRVPEGDLGQNLVLPLGQFSALGGLSQVVDSKEDTDSLKTSFKTNTERTDDEAFADLLAVLKQTARKVTGREPSSADKARWKEVAQLLATELEVAASRTDVTSAPAFLAEHLRRRLRKADARQIEHEVSEAASGLASPPGPAKPELTHEQLEEQAQLLAGLMQGGATMGELEEEHAGNFRPAQWHQIRSIALAQASVTATKPKS